MPEFADAEDQEEFWKKNITYVHRAKRDILDISKEDFS